MYHFYWGNAPRQLERHPRGHLFPPPAPAALSAPPPASVRHLRTTPAAHHPPPCTPPTIPPTIPHAPFPAPGPLAPVSAARGGSELGSWRTLWRPQDSHFLFLILIGSHRVIWTHCCGNTRFPLGSVPLAPVPPVLAEDPDPQRLRHGGFAPHGGGPEEGSHGLRPGPQLFSAAPFTRLTAHAVLKVTRWLLTLAIASASSQEEGRRRGGKWALFSFLSSFKKAFWFSLPNPPI